MVAAPRARNPLPSHGMRLSLEALSPAITTIRSARPTWIMSYARAMAWVAPAQRVDTEGVSCVLKRCVVYCVERAYCVERVYCVNGV